MSAGMQDRVLVHRHTPLHNPPGLHLRPSSSWASFFYLLTAATIAFCLTYMVAFPKGGTKVLGVPITIGYLLTLVLLLVALPNFNLKRIPTSRCVIIVSALLLGLWSASIIRENGFRSGGLTLSYFISVFYLPVFAMIAFSALTMDRYWRTVERTLLFAIRFVAIYGILLFVYRQITGAWIEIPYLTVNVADLGSLDSKYIDRGGVFKLISTYNNGNLFGVSMLIVGPLYMRFEKRRAFRWLFSLALLLTLSRTVWIGLLLLSLIGAFSRGMRPSTIFYVTVGVAIALLGIWGMLALMGQELTFLFDASLGGRIGQVTGLRDAQWIPERAFRGIAEITYLGVIDGFGYVGLILFLLYLLSPIYFLYGRGTPFFSVRRDSACLQGLVIYAIVSMSDGAFSFIPVMMFYWMIAGLGLWYQRQEVTARAPVR